MMKAFLKFLRRVASSRVGHVLLVIHLFLVVFDFAQKSPVSRAENNRAYEAGEIMSSSTLLAGRGFHYHYESPLLKLLILVDLPGLLLSLIFSLVLIPINYFAPLGAYDESWVAAGIFLLGTSIQWQFVGYCLESVFRSGRGGERHV